MDQSTYSSALRRPKFDESPHSYFYRTGNYIYKIRKTNPVYNTLAIKERYAREALRLTQFWGGEVGVAVAPLVKLADGGYALGAQGASGTASVSGASDNAGPDGEVTDYALQMLQLSDHYLLNRQLEAGKLTPTGMGRLARFMAQHHLESSLGEGGAEAGRPENFRGLSEEAFYQSKKYLQSTITEAMLEMISRPVNKFLDEGRKLFLRRVKKGHVVECHGDFVPEHIFMKGTEIHAVAPLDSQPKFRMLDAAGDVASLINELLLDETEKAAELTAVFIKRYISAAKDRDLPRILPLYQTLQAVHKGVLLSERMLEADPESEAREVLRDRAHRYFNLAVKVARQIEKPA